jgi:VanZ family protein
MYIGDSNVLNSTFIIFFRADHILHTLVFVPWAFFCVKLSKNLLPWFVLGILYAGSTEMAQYLIPYRSFNVSDMLANVIGVVIGFCIFVSFKKIVNNEG